MTQQKQQKQQGYKIVSEYIAEHGITEINSPELFKEIIRQVVNAIPENILHEDICLMFDSVMRDIIRD